MVDGLFTEDLEDRVVTGRIFNIQRFSTEDGPGIRTTVFLKGCPLLCPWCANPESQLSIAEVGHSDPLCDHCNRCVEVCDRKAIALNSAGGVIIDRRLCDNCAKCVEVCGPRALRVLGDQRTLDEVLEEIKKDQAYYRNSGGGVTCSGGEPLAQARFVAALFKRCHEAGFHTTLDTCGAAPKRALERVLDYTDLVLFDLKIHDRAAHTAIAGRSNQQIFANAKYVVSRGIRMIARMPLIPGYTDSEENVSAIAGFIRKLGAHVPVNLLPYHRFGMNKYAMLDRAYEPGDLKPPPPERVQKIVDRFQSLGLECEVVT
ncbi:MAG: glycyl-radical enzyme activating protein [Deltaproteobacteria bacterium]|nr:glycyl-radical enzyme activating protein [Deltaproteobacteria bacterium]